MELQYCSDFFGGNPQLQLKLNFVIRQIPIFNFSLLVIVSSRKFTLISPALQIGLMFYICIFWTSSSIFGAVYVFPFEKIYLVKERKADMYRLSVYYVCSTLCDMVAHVLYPTCFMCILYFMAGFKRTVQCFFLTLGATLLIAITSQVNPIILSSRTNKALIFGKDKWICYLMIGSWRTFWSCSYEYQKGGDGRLPDIDVVSSHWRLLCSGIQITT